MDRRKLLKKIDAWLCAAFGHTPVESVSMSAVGGNDFKISAVTLSCRHCGKELSKQTYE